MSALEPDALDVIRRDDEAVPRHVKLADSSRVLWDRHCLLAEVDRLTAALTAEREMREAFEGAAADLANAGIAERDALRKVITIQERARAARIGEEQ